MKTLVCALGLCALAMVAQPQPASAGMGFEICLNGVGCISKPNKHERRRRNQWNERRSWQDYCDYNPQDYRCDPYRYRQPPPRNCYYSPEYGWECY